MLFIFICDIFDCRYFHIPVSSITSMPSSFNLYTYPGIGIIFVFIIHWSTSQEASCQQISGQERSGQYLDVTTLGLDHSESCQEKSCKLLLCVISNYVSKCMHFCTVHTHGTFGSHKSCPKKVAIKIF